MLNTVTARFPLYRIQAGTLQAHVANSTPGRDCYKDEATIGGSGDRELHVRANVNGAGRQSGNCFDYGKYGTEGIRVETGGQWDSLRVEVQADGSLRVGGPDTAVAVPLSGVRLPASLQVGGEPIRSLCFQRSFAWDDKAFMTVNGRQTWELGDGQMTAVAPQSAISVGLFGLDWHRYDQEFVMGAKTFVSDQEKVTPAAI